MFTLINSYYIDLLDLYVKCCVGKLGKIIRKKGSRVSKLTYKKERCSYKRSEKKKIK